jgi:hypothetical protein
MEMCKKLPSTTTFTQMQYIIASFVQELEWAVTNSGHRKEIILSA